MKTIYLIRHAKSSWDDPSLRDVERPLNKRGFRDAPFMAKLLFAKDNNIQVDRLVSSPANRAFTTATFFAKALGLDESDIQKESQIYEAYPRDILNLINQLPNDLNTVLLFGHNPTFTSLANLFSSDYIANIPTCGIVQLKATVDSWKDFNQQTAHLAAFYYPKQYFS